MFHTPFNQNMYSDSQDVAIAALQIVKYTLVHVVIYFAFKRSHIIASHAPHPEAVMVGLSTSSH